MLEGDRFYYYACEDSSIANTTCDIYEVRLGTKWTDENGAPVARPSDGIATSKLIEIEDEHVQFWPEVIYSTTSTLPIDAKRERLNSNSIKKNFMDEKYFPAMNYLSEDADFPPADTSILDFNNKDDCIENGCLLFVTETKWDSDKRVITMTSLAA